MKSITDLLAKPEGSVVFDDLSSLDFSNGTSAQLASLKEDLLQIEYPGGILLDVGWFPSFDVDGSFKVQVIKDGDWVKPLWQKEAKEYETLITILNAASAFSAIVSDDQRII